MPKYLLIITLLLMIPIFMFGYDYNETRNLTLDAAEITLLNVDCGAGSLHITGVEGLKRIEVEAEIELRDISRRDVDEYLEKSIDLRIGQNGSVASLVSKTNSRRDRYSRAMIHLTVRVPKKIDLQIDDGSGSMTIEDINGSLEIHDGSGSMEVSNIAGNVRIDDGSGSMELADIDGDLDVDDGSGSLTIRRVSGNVIVADGSGSINIRGVGQNVKIREDGSGGMTIRDVKGTVDRRH